MICRITPFRLSVPLGEFDLQKPCFVGRVRRSRNPTPASPSGGVFLFAFLCCRGVLIGVGGVFRVAIVHQ